MTFDKTAFWDVNFYNHPSLTDDMVITSEEILGVKLPVELIELLKVQNGGYTKGFAFPMFIKTTWSESHVPLTELFGIVTDPSILTSQNMLDSEYLANEWGFPSTLR